MTKRNSNQTRNRILQAATEEFSECGYGDARVDSIAKRAVINKRMLYHHFGNKDDLYLAVLEEAYREIRSHEDALNLDNLEPEAAILTLVEFTFDYFVDHPEFINLLNNENLYQAAHIKRSQKILQLHSPLVTHIREIVKRGVKQGSFRKDVDPVQLYITIASLGYFYLSNAYTLGTIFNKNLLSKRALNARLKHIKDVVIGFLNTKHSS